MSLFLTCNTSICIHSWVTVIANLPEDHRGPDRWGMIFDDPKVMDLTILTKESGKTFESPNTHICFAYIPPCKATCNGWKLWLEVHFFTLFNKAKINKLGYKLPSNKCMWKLPQKYLFFFYFLHKQEVSILLFFSCRRP